MDKLCYCGTQHQNESVFCDDCDGKIKVTCKDDICCIEEYVDVSESDTYYVQQR